MWALLGVLVQTSTNLSHCSCLACFYIPKAFPMAFFESATAEQAKDIAQT
jgi:hypothetical protein